jgi:hypothetical protein
VPTPEGGFAWAVHLCGDANGHVPRAQGGGTRPMIAICEVE